MDYYEKIAGHFQGTIETVALSADSLAAPIEQASRLMTDALLADRKIIACGNGPDAALAQLFCSNLLGCVEQERPALPAMVLGSDTASLTAISQGSGAEEIFSRPLRALAQPADVLIAICSSAPANNLIPTLQAARERNMGVVLMSNLQAVELSALLQQEDVELCVESDDSRRSVEIFSMALHSMCMLIEHGLFGGFD
jgi:phosphoheptose isomerase